MTETEWMRCTDFDQLFRFVLSAHKGWWSRVAEIAGFKNESDINFRDPFPYRKLQFCACAWCRSNANLMAEPLLAKAVGIIERFADGLATDEETSQVDDDLASIINEERQSVESNPVLNGAAQLGDMRVFQRTRFVQAVMGAGFMNSTWTEEGYSHQYQSYRNALDAATHIVPWESEDTLQESLDQLSLLLKHIFGNPFRQHSKPSTGAVVKLADAVYQGEAVAYALHDALLESGHPELAEHFRDPNEWHPKGCWALDLILGKS